LKFRIIGKPVFKGKDIKELLERNKVGKISMRSSEWNNYSKEAKKLVRKMLHRDPEKRINLQDICNEKWIKKHQKIKTEQSFQINSKSKLEEPTDLNGTLNNTNQGSMKNFTSFKNSFFGRLINKSKTEIIYSKKIAYSIANSNIENLDEEIQNEGDINHSKYSMEPKFMQISHSRNSLHVLPLPYYMENYSVSL